MSFSWTWSRHRCNMCRTSIALFSAPAAISPLTHRSTSLSRILVAKAMIRPRRIERRTNKDLLCRDRPGRRETNRSTGAFMVHRAEKVPAARRDWEVTNPPPPSVQTRVTSSVPDPIHAVRTADRMPAVPDALPAVNRPPAVHDHGWTWTHRTAGYVPPRPYDRGPLWARRRSHISPYVTLVATQNAPGCGNATSQNSSTRATRPAELKSCDGSTSIRMPGPKRPTTA